jgi:hypothetical protein
MVSAAWCQHGDSTVFTVCQVVSARCIHCVGVMLLPDVSAFFTVGGGLGGSVFTLEVCGCMVCA